MRKERKVETDKLVVGTKLWERPNGPPWKYKPGDIVAHLPDEPGGPKWVVRVWYEARQEHRWRVADAIDFECGQFGFWPPPHDGAWPPPEDEKATGDVGPGVRNG